jgi:hypothetical protein
VTFRRDVDIGEIGFSPAASEEVMQIEFVHLCPDHSSRLRADGFCEKCGSVVPRNEAMVVESENSQLRRLLELKDWVKWRCPAHCLDLDFNFVDPGRFPKGLNGAGYCHRCCDKVWLRDADRLVHPAGQSLLDREFEEQFRARAV